MNGGAVRILGPTPTVSNTRTIAVFGLDGNDTISLDEANGALPRATLIGGSGDDSLTGGSANDLLIGQAGNDHSSARAARTSSSAEPTTTRSRAAPATIRRSEKPATT